VKILSSPTMKPQTRVIQVLFEVTSVKFRHSKC